MNDTLRLLAAAFGIGLGVVFAIGLFVPTLGKVIYGTLHPRRIVVPQQRRLATWMWTAMASALVFIGTGSLMWMATLIGLGLLCACAAIGCGVRLRLLLAHAARQQRLAQEAAFQQELEQVLRGER